MQLMVYNRNKKILISIKEPEYSGSFISISTFVPVGIYFALEY